MEFWPTKIDWSIYEEKLADGEFMPRDCIKKLECEAPPDSGNLNSALSDFFPLLEPHLPETICNAIGPFVGAIATCGIKDWPQSNDGPSWLYDNSRDLSELDILVGQLYSPATVSDIVARFEKITLEELSSALTAAWSQKSNDAADYSMSEPNYFVDSNDFLDYLLAWFAAFKESANTNDGIGIGGG